MVEYDGNKTSDFKRKTSHFIFDDNQRIVACSLYKSTKEKKDLIGMTPLAQSYRFAIVGKCSRKKKNKRKIKNLILKIRIYFLFKNFTEFYYLWRINKDFQ